MNRTRMHGPAAPGLARRVALAAVAAALALGLAGACGGTGEGDGDGAGASASPTARASSPPPSAGSPSSPGASSPAAASGSDGRPAPGLTGIGASDGRVLGQGELDRAVLADGDVTGFRVGPMDGPPPGGESADTSRCEPLTAVINGRPEPRAKAVAYRQIVGARDGTPAVSEFLTAHGTQDATSLVNRLRAAVENCADGFTASGGDGPSTYQGVKRLTAADAGDDTLAYQVTGDFEGTPVPLVFQVLRVGGTVATFYTADFEGTATPGMPAALLTAQAAKLR
ncbi:hypothetical protein [Streptomyces sp. NBC_01429]|uniref:hypothetical protein n=1 Tax=Streptomyces sp. NBC_01429 TaxID=2903862 RepID=UPI002E2D16A2|nr:hypothetical protein [Streptomyces sp. NBC_01429]